MGHTPGLWKVVRYGDGDSLVIHSDDVNRVCFMATPGSYGDPEKIAADAHLIAAAPDMYEALKDCRNAMWADNPADGWKEIIEAADAALRKAGGD